MEDLMKRRKSFMDFRGAQKSMISDTGNLTDATLSERLSRMSA